MFRRAIGAVHQKGFAVFGTRKFSSSEASSGLLGWYSRLLEKYPLSTKAVTSGVITGAGDTTCQLMTKKEGDSFDVPRFLRFTFLGTFLIAPALHVWYGRLVQMFPGTTIADVAKRIAFDQFVFAPCFLTTFMSSLMILEGNGHLIMDRLRTSLVETTVSNWSVWIPAQVINFKFMPPHFQVLFANVVGFGWNIVLSFQANKAIEK